MNKKVFATLLVLLIPNLLFAHLPLDGVNAFVNGVAFPFIYPVVFLLVFVAGLYLGQRLGRFHQFYYFAYLSVFLLGELLSFWIPFESEVAMLLMCVLFGSMLVGCYRSSFFTLVGCLLMSGFFVGLFVVIEDLGLREKIHFTFGCSLTVLTSFAIAYLLTIRFNRPWQKTGVRVLGSWVVAISVLSLVYFLKKG